VDSIPLGQDFRGHLNGIIGGCVAVLAIIGPKWIDTRNNAGTRRLEDPDDFVRIELEAALSRDIPVVPVLVGHAPMPGIPDLPPSLESMAYRQSIEVRPDPDFHNDATRLVAALRAIVDPNAPPVPTVSVSPTSPALRWLWPGAFTAAALAAVALVMPALEHLREIPPAETRIAVPVPIRIGAVSMTLSPDGTQLAYLDKDDPEARLWLRALNSTATQPLPGTQGANAPFWSPDGRSIAFFARGSLKRLDLGSGQPLVLAPATGEMTGAWGARGDIIFNPGSLVGLRRVAATGGPTSELTKVLSKVSGHRVLGFHPDGLHFLFADTGGGTYLGSLDGSPPVRLTDDVGPGAVLPSGWLLLLSLGAGTSTPTNVLVAQKLDAGNARLTGERITIASGVSAMSASSNIVAYRTAQLAGQRQLTWLDRNGTQLGTVGEADATLDSPRAAPDGRSVVVSRAVNGNRDLWLLAGERASRLTFATGDDNYPVWSPDGQRITYTSSQTGKFILHEKLASGAGGEQSIDTPDQSAYPTGWSSDGKYLLYFAQAATAGEINIRALPAAGDRKSLPILETPFTEVWGQVSPDGRWMAYQSDETGRYEIYVRPFQPQARQASQWLISTAGGVHSMWSADGKELFFLNQEGAMMAAKITIDGAAVVPGKPVKLFDTQIWGGGIDNATGRQYDLGPDGRFLINRETDGEAVPTVTFIQNWNPGAKH